jgi:hypothetical protein
MWNIIGSLMTMKTPCNHVVFVSLEDFYFELEENKFLACFSLAALFCFMLISAIL